MNVNKIENVNKLKMALNVKHNITFKNMERGIDDKLN